MAQIKHKRQHRHDMTNAGHYNATDMALTSNICQSAQ